MGVEGMVATWTIPVYQKQLGVEEVEKSPWRPLAAREGGEGASAPVEN